MIMTLLHLRKSEKGTRKKGYRMVVYVPNTGTRLTKFHTMLICFQYKRIKLLLKYIRSHGIHMKSGKNKRVKQYVDLEVKKSKQHGDLAVLFYVDFTEHEQGEKTKLQTCLCHSIPNSLNISIPNDGQVQAFGQVDTLKSKRGRRIYP